MFKLRQRNCVLIILGIILMPCVIVIIITAPELSPEQTLSQRLGECHMRLQYLESLYRARQEDVAILSQYITMQQQNVNSISTTTVTPYNQTTIGINSMHSSIHGDLTILDSLSSEAKQIFYNTSHAFIMHSLFNSSAKIHLPTVYTYMPHLLNDPNSLRPALLKTRGRFDVNIVLGIPTVKREKQSYLIGTLNNLIENMNEEEQNETLIVVYIGESDSEVVHQIVKEIERTLEVYVDAGVIDIIAPAPSYYPDFNKLRITLNDPLERVKWRTKQNLDYAYLMTYARTKGTFYVQLEDDIIVKRNFLSIMKKFAHTKSAELHPDQPPWILLDFCQLGFIGKMFKSADLPYFITFIHMFYNDKPVDWLLIHYIESKVCRTDTDHKSCNLQKSKYWLHYHPSLFQHIGTRSSLKGKVQTLKDRHFGSKVPAFFAHTRNPPAFVKTNIAAYKNFILKRAYKGETYFWGLLPQPGDKVQFIFEQPQPLRHFLFRSGNSEYPSDRFHNTTIEVLPVDALRESSSLWSTYNSTSDGYLIVGSFDNRGVAEGLIDPKMGNIKEIRLHVRSDSENWVLLSEIDLQVFDINSSDGKRTGKKNNR